MDSFRLNDADELGQLAARDGGDLIRAAIGERGSATIILATGMSQFATLANLVQRTDIDWQAVTVFHLDEYIGIPESHPASFRKYLKERFTAKVPATRDFWYIDGESPDPTAECNRLNSAIREHTIDVAFVGIGENSHLAFNDPPADFTTTEPYIVVELDELCRRQQLGEGWFTTLEEVPRQAISMSVREILRSKAIIVSVPDERKAKAALCAIEGPVTAQCPASILQEHRDCRIYLDPESSSLLTT